MKRLISAGAAALLLVACREANSARTTDRPKPELFLLTALPLVWSEDFGLDQPGSPAVKRLEQDYRVTPIDLPSDLPDSALLLAAQPRALPAEELVALDKWVRSGGRMLLLADPMLEWPSKRPLGDPLRPPPIFMDTGLLAHWGLRLDSPNRRGPRVETLGGFDVLTVSPGELSGRCPISSDHLVARCRVDKGRATVIADADLLDVADLGRGARHNLDGVLEELARLEHP